MNEETQRTFIALPLLPEFRAEAENFLLSMQQESKGVKWVRSEQFHVTLHFFGETPVRKFALIREQAAACARKFSALELHLEGIGFFPNAGKPRVIWAPLHGDVDPLCHLQANLALRMHRNGFEVEERKFQPHVTLGRVKKPWALRLPEHLTFPKTKKQRLERIVFYRSRLTPEGPRYDVIDSFPIGGQAA